MRVLQTLRLAQVLISQNLYIQVMDTSSQPIDEVGGGYIGWQETLVDVNVRVELLAQWAAAHDEERLAMEFHLFHKRQCWVLLTSQAFYMRVLRGIVNMCFNDGEQYVQETLFRFQFLLQNHHVFQIVGMTCS